MSKFGWGGETWPPVLYVELPLSTQAIRICERVQSHKNPLPYPNLLNRSVWC